MRKILLTTIGSLGDLHPFIAIGLALNRRGFRVLMAVPEDQLGTHINSPDALGLSVTVSSDVVLPV